MKGRRRYLKRITLENKIILLLEPFTTSRDLMTVPESITQGGMSKELMIRRNNISRALTDLSSRGLVFSRTKHIKGLQRRRKAYFLTEEGSKQAIAAASDLDTRYVPVKMMDGKVKEFTLDKCRREVSSLLGREVSRFDLITNHMRGRMVDLSSIGGRGEKWMDPRIPCIDRFFGREVETRILVKELDDGIPVISLIGIAGQGKTSIAAEAISRITRDVVWVDMNSWMTMDILLDEIEISLSGGDRSSFSGKRGIYPRMRSVSSRLSSIGSVLVLDDLHRCNNEIQEGIDLFKEEARKGEWTLMVISRTRPFFYSRSQALIDDKIMELELGGMDRGSSLEMLGSLDVSEEDGERIFEMTSGNPLAMRICSLTPSSDAKEIDTSFRSFLEENVFKDLPERERNLLDFLSAFDLPADPRIMMDLVDSSRKDLESLFKKLLVRRYPDGRIDLHDSMKEGIRSSLSRERYHEMRSLVRDYHDLIPGDDDIVQFILLSIELGDNDSAIEALLLHGDHLIGRGYLILASSVLEMDYSDLNEEMKVRWEILSHDCCISLGMEMIGIDHLKKAGEYAEDLIKKRNDRITLQLTSMILNRLAEHGLRRGKHKEVIARLSRSLTISRRIGAKEQEARTLGNIGSAYLDLGHYDLALRFLLDANSIFESIGNPRGSAICKMNLGQVLSLEQNLSGALREYLECILITRRMDSMRLYSQASYRVARLYRFINEEDDSLKFYSDSVIGYTGSGDMDHAFLVLSEMMSLCSEYGKREGLKATLEKMIRISNGGGWTYLKKRLGWTGPGSSRDRDMIDHIHNLLKGDPVEVGVIESMVRENYHGIPKRIRLSVIRNLPENFQQV